MNELDDAGQLRVGQRLLAGGLLLQHLVQQQLQRVREVRQRGARARDLPRVVAQVAAEQLAQDLVQVHLALWGIRSWPFTRWYTNISIWKILNMEHFEIITARIFAFGKRSINM